MAALYLSVYVCMCLYRHAKSVCMQMQAKLISKKVDDIFF